MINYSSATIWKTNRYKIIRWNYTKTTEVINHIEDVFRRIIIENIAEYNICSTSSVLLIMIVNDDKTTINYGNYIVETE